MDKSIDTTENAQIEANGIEITRLTEHQKAVLTGYCKNYFERKKSYADFMENYYFDFAKYVHFSEAVEIARTRIYAVCEILLIVCNSTKNSFSFYADSSCSIELLTVKDDDTPYD